MHIQIQGPIGRLSECHLRSKTSAGLTCSGVVHLRREFENFSSAAQTLSFRWSRGHYARAERATGPSLTDLRGPNVHAIETAQTFLTTQQVDDLVDLYEDGMPIGQIAEKLQIHRHTVARHLEHRGIPIRVRGLANKHIAEAIRLYAGGLTLAEVGQRYGASAQAVRRAISAKGVTIRPRGRNRHLVGSA